MDFENRSPFPALAYDIEDAQGEESHVFVARGTFKLRAASRAEADRGLTHVATLAEQQAEVVVSDEYHGEINRSSVKYESDLAQHKPKCDVIVIGSAHSPTGEPAPRVEVGIHIERPTAIPGIEAVGTLLEHRLVVHGPRAFVRGGAARQARLAEEHDDGWSLTEPEPFTSLPIRYEHAFGGDLKVHAADDAAEGIDAAHRLPEEARAKHPDGASAPIAHTACLYNPLGVGWLEAWYADALGVESWPAPRIEAPGSEITVEAWDRLVRGEARAGDSPELTPRGLGVIAKSWQPRLARAGTFDQRWLEERWPLMPPDFDMAYWNGAHPDMQCPHLYGGEIVELWNLLPPGEAPLRDGRVALRLQIPDVRVAVRFRTDSGRWGWGGPGCDTLIIDLENMTATLVWRLLAPVSLGIARASLAVVDEQGRA